MGSVVSRGPLDFPKSWTDIDQKNQLASALAKFYKYRKYPPGADTPQKVFDFTVLFHATFGDTNLCLEGEDTPLHMIAKCNDKRPDASVKLLKLMEEHEELFKILDFDALSANNILRRKLTAQDTVQCTFPKHFDVASQLRDMKARKSQKFTPPIASRSDGKSTFETSNFKKFYVPINTDDLNLTSSMLESLRGVVYGYAEYHNLLLAFRDEVNKFMRSIEHKCFHAQHGNEAFTNPQDAAQRIWTSAIVLNIPRHRIELCSMINAAIRADHPDNMIKSAAMFAKYVKRSLKIQTVRGAGVDPDAVTRSVVCYRGSGLARDPDPARQQWLDFYTGMGNEGKKYRIPGFLATALKHRETAIQFAERQFDNFERDCVIYEISTGDEGCFNVGKVTKGIQGEHEFLFVPYSAFRIESVEFKTDAGAGSKKNMHVVKLTALKDNKKCEADLPLAPFY